MKRSFAIFMIVGVLVACEGFKKAMGAHTDTVAKAGSQELTVDRLSALLSQAKVPVTQDIAKAITNVWVDYQLLGVAAAHNDSLTDPKAIDDALWPIIAQMRARDMPLWSMAFRNWSLNFTDITYRPVA